MSRLAPETLKLSNDEQAELEQLIKRHNTPQQIVLRGKIVLYANLGKNNREISRILNISRNMVILWRNRWLASSGSELLTSQRLEDLERVGTPAKFSMEQVIELFALACSHPVDYGRQISHWTFIFSSRTNHHITHHHHRANTTHYYQSVWRADTFP